MKSITDFIEENQDTIFRFLVYNKFNIWTPEQQENKYCDESIYTDNHYDFAKITNVINTPNGAMLELDIIDPADWTRLNRKEYRLLNDITLERFDIDNGEEEDE